LNEVQAKLGDPFPGDCKNVGFYQVGAGSANPFSVIALDSLPDLHVTGAGSGGQFFARWRYEQVDDAGMFDVHEGEVVDGYRRIDNITDEALAAFTAAYPGESISRDDVFDYVYGLLHSPEYRETYAADLKEMLPRIPFAKDFRAFADAGKRLAELHLRYETVEPYPLQGSTPPVPVARRTTGSSPCGTRRWPSASRPRSRRSRGCDTTGR
jgi:predicted helicase